MKNKWWSVPLDSALMKFIVLSILLVVIQHSVAAAGKIDPFADNDITCKEMHAYPHRIFDGDIDLGSGHGSLIEVDYSCHGSLASLPFLKRIYQITETIRSEGGPQLCTGSIIHAHWRYYRFDLLRAGLAPSLLSKRDAGFRRSEKLQLYFEYWASESSSNFRRYKAFFVEYRKAHPLLSRHYQQHFGFARKRADATATEALNLFLSRAAGSFPGSSPYSDAPPKQLSEIAQLLKSNNMDILSLQEAIAKNPPEKEIDQALKTALLNDRPRKVINLLVDGLKALDHGDESALFFAIRRPKNVALLLARGASVDYANGFGKTPLFYAVENNDHVMAELLMRHGANPNRAYKSADELKENECAYNIQHTRRTPLMHAAQHSDTKMMKLLIKYGARRHDVDDLRFNAFDYAMKHYRTSNMKYLRSLGMESNRPQPH